MPTVALTRCQLSAPDAEVEAAVAAHGGESAPATRRFRELSPADRRDLLAFLRSL